MSSEWTTKKQNATRPSSHNQGGAQPGGSLIQVIENEIKESLDIILPTYIRNVLIYTGFDSSAALSELTVGDFCTIEDFVRNELQDVLSLERNVQYDDFYGIYSSSKSNFKILPGHKKLLIEIQKFYKGRKVEAKNRNAEKQKSGENTEDQDKNDTFNCLGFLDDDKQQKEQKSKRRKRSRRNSDTNSDGSECPDLSKEVMIDGVKRKCFEEGTGRSEDDNQALVVYGDESRSHSPSEETETSFVDRDDRGLLGILNTGLRIANII